MGEEGGRDCKTAAEVRAGIDGGGIIVVGGGAAGLTVAARLADAGVSVTVLERTEKPGKKIYITGKGRCNLTNLSAADDFLKNVVTGGKFLRGCVSRFSPACTVEYFESIGLKTVVERGNRVFPFSQKASDVTKALAAEIGRGGGRIITDCFVKEALRSGIKDENRGSGFILQTSRGEFRARRVVLACGGKSYPSTGSDGYGYVLCQKLGHTLVPPVPSLTSLILKEDVSELEGLSLKNINASVEYADDSIGGESRSDYGGGKSKIREESKAGKADEFGEMLFTKNGVSGPIILTLSSLTSRFKNRTLKIDLKPALDFITLDKRILSDFNSQSNRQLKNALSELLPKSIIPYIIRYAKLDGDKKVNVISKTERAALCGAVKGLLFTVSGNGGFNESVVTSGGVDLSEVNPKTMESRLVSDLYIVGELLDIDALTGGYNLQLAWSTAFACAEALLQEIEKGVYNE